MRVFRCHFTTCNEYFTTIIKDYGYFINFKFTVGPNASPIFIIRLTERWRFPDRLLMNLLTLWSVWLKIQASAWINIFVVVTKTCHVNCCWLIQFPIGVYYQFACSISLSFYRSTRYIALHSRNISVYILHLQWAPRYCLSYRNH
jgi:hypothetical protein